MFDIRTTSKTVTGVLMLVALLITIMNSAQKKRK